MITMVFDFDGTLIDNKKEMILLTREAIFQANICSMDDSIKIADAICNEGGDLISILRRYEPDTTLEQMHKAQEYFDLHSHKEIYSKSDFFPYIKTLFQILYNEKIPIIISSYSCLKPIMSKIKEGNLDLYIDRIFSRELGHKNEHMAEIREKYKENIVLVSDVTNDMFLDADIRFRVSTDRLDPVDGECVISEIGDLIPIIKKGGIV